MASVVKYFVPNCGKFVNVVPAFKNGIDTLIACFKDPWGKTSGGEWKHPIFWCCQDIAVCCWANYCGPCVLCHSFGDTNGHGCEEECLTCCLMSCIGCGCCYTFAMRQKMRQKYGVSGNRLTDCIALCCCPNCAFIQQTNAAGDKPPCNGAITINCPPALAKMSTKVSDVGAKL